MIGAGRSHEDHIIKQNCYILQKVSRLNLKLFIHLGHFSNCIANLYVIGSSIISCSAGVYILAVKDRKEF